MDLLRDVARGIAAFENRETGLGPGFEFEQISRDWFEDEANDKVFVEIHEKSWLPVPCVWMRHEISCAGLAPDLQLHGRLGGV